MDILIVLVLLLFWASVWDFYSGKIPNILIFMGCCYGMVNLIMGKDVIKFVLGIIFPIILLFPLYRIGVIGAGDIKLFSMIGFYFSFMEVIFCIFMAFLLGALVSVISFVRNDNFLERISYLFSYLKDCFNQGHFRYYYLDSKGKTISGSKYSKSKIHFAIPIFFSVLLHLGGVF